MKIDNGFNLGKITLAELMDLCQRIKLQMENLKQDAITKIIIENAVYYYDLKTIGFIKSSDERDKLDYWVNYLKDKTKTEVRTETVYDFSVHAYFFPLEDQVLALIYGQRGDLLEAWYAQPEIREYHFLAEPELIPSLEQARREKHWLKVLGAKKLPEELGLRFDFTSPEIEFELALAKEHYGLFMPSFLDRRSKLVRNLLHNYWQQTAGRSVINHIPFDAWLETEDAKNRVIEVTGDVSAVLVEEIPLSELE